LVKPRKYPCPKCGKVNTRTYKLKVEPKTMICDYCDERFQVKESLELRRGQTVE